MRQIFLAHIDTLREMLEWIRQQVQAAGFEGALLHKIELASEEALVNIIEHGIGKQGGQLELEVRTFPKNRVEIILRDEGPRFNPLEREKIDLSQSLEEREIGGLGIHLMRQCMDEVQYRYELNTNTLILTKRLTHSSRKK